MTTHTHPEIEADVLERSKATASEIGDSENRLRTDMYKIRDELKSDIAGLETSVGGLQSDMKDMKSDVKDLKSDMKDMKSDVKDLKDILLPPKP